MPRVVEGRKYITFELTDEQYEQIKVLAAKSHTSMNAIVRDYVEQGLNGTVTENNIEFLIPIIREQIRTVIEPMMDRQIKLTSKTCIQAGTAAYLSADAILKFVPPAQREEVADSYEAARKKSIQYMRGNTLLEE